MKSKLGLGLSLALAVVAVVAAVAVVHATGEGPWPGRLSPLAGEATLDSGGISWPGAEVSVSLKSDYMFRSARAHFTLAPDLALAPGGRKAVIWASETDIARRSVFLAQAGQQGTWSTQVLFQDAEQEAWLPAVAYSGTQLLAAWVQGTYTVPLGNVVQYDVARAQTQVVMTNAYGYVSPRLAVAPSRVHMVYAARRPAERSGIWAGDLYHVHRALTLSTWSTPTVVVSYTAVVTQAIQAGIRNPHIALSEDGRHLHVAWQQIAKQEINGTIVSLPDSIWYISGTLNAQDVLWGQPMRVSSSTLQMDAVQPDIAVDNHGGAHVVFTISTYRQDRQYILYRRLVSNTWSMPVTLTAQAINASKNSPTWAASAVDTADGLVCVTWHGYYGGAGTSREEIFLRCSHDRGVTWQVTVNVAESPNIFSIFPVVGLDEWGQVHVAWGELVESPSMDDNLYDAFYRRGPNEVHVSFLPVIAREG